MGQWLHNANLCVRVCVRVQSSVHACCKFVCRYENVNVNQNILFHFLENNE